MATHVVNSCAHYVHVIVDIGLKGYKWGCDFPGTVSVPSLVKTHHLIYKLRCALLRNFAQRRIVFSYRRLWTNIRSHLQGLSNPSRICETSVINCNSPLPGGSLKSRIKAAKQKCGSLNTCFARQVKRPSSAITPQHPATGLSNGSIRATVRH